MPSAARKLRRWASPVPAQGAPRPSARGSPRGLARPPHAASALPHMADRTWRGRLPCETLARSLRDRCLARGPDRPASGLLVLFRSSFPRFNGQDRRACARRPVSESPIRFLMLGRLLSRPIPLAPQTALERRPPLSCVWLARLRRREASRRNHACQVRRDRYRSYPAMFLTGT
jgi:hypothetical protein